MNRLFPFLFISYQRLIFNGHYNLDHRGSGRLSTQTSQVMDHRGSGRLSTQTSQVMDHRGSGRLQWRDVFSANISWQLA